MYEKSGVFLRTPWRIPMHVLVTGVAGFIGHQLSLRLLAQGHTVVGIDNLNDYYDVNLKKARLAELDPLDNFRFVFGDLADDAFMDNLFATEGFTHVAHLAAQAGVRYSIENPRSYIQSNLVGFGNILEGCRHNKVQHLVYASSSSVYGLNGKRPYAEEHPVNHPVSLYAASKKSNELMAHSYSHLYNLPTTGLRFFTVYGPWNRPDMALHLFATAIVQGKPINVFNNGQMQRDFTYIDDIVEGVVRTLQLPATADEAWDAQNPAPDTSPAPWRIYNIGNNNTVALGDFIALLEKSLGMTAIKNYMPMQPGDVVSTHASVDNLTTLTGFSPCTPLEEGIDRFVAWYKNYYKI